MPAARWRCSISRGGRVVLVYKHRLAGHGTEPERSLAELRNDKQWLKNDL